MFYHLPDKRLSRGRYRESSAYQGQSRSKSHIRQEAADLMKLSSENKSSTMKWNDGPSGLQVIYSI